MSKLTKIAFTSFGH